MNIKLRNFELSDAKSVAALVGEDAVSKWTANIPFPYSEQDAIDWITHIKSDTSKKLFAVELNDELVACVSYWPNKPNGFEIGYWVGRRYWGRGICTTALQMLLNSERIPANEPVIAKVMLENIGSQRVLQKCGFSFLKMGHISKGGKRIEAKYYVRFPST